MTEREDFLEWVETRLREALGQTVSIAQEVGR